MKTCVFAALAAVVAMVSGAQETVALDYPLAGEAKTGGTAVRTSDLFPPAPYFATSPLAIALAPKFEFPDESWDVAGLRLSLLVGSHRAVYALDIGVLGNFADYEMAGVGIGGLFNSIGESGGAILVAGLFNFTAFDLSGCQIAALYCCTEGEHGGLQAAFGNYAGSLTGAQIGFVNYADRLRGVQLGALNFNGSSPISFLPVMNASF